mmetsp:Transcript_11415/g.18948  ORF Transcript_11415/g.18948 Transcript_11415/m.18948 type:complete len:253 (-) Transcript_11415:87-845(-)|eukprot:CAMPEP_0119005106 /NCGR_PEP_ID=MMETSP1176-20130426/1529_1 /TAXON_ID=265551 /ORGANISM="Synedropsis recta cf, Strain CCMP1620" /LENGTH=252 /DNA_ID=CAMNT_0006956875 /DNA_START=72 /DNA_END=830 /DNA_ORIENTATION=+
MTNSSSLVLLLLLTVGASSFQPISFVPRTSSSQLSSGGKGFGAPPPAPKPPKKEEESKEVTKATVKASPAPELNVGQQSLMEMRRQKAEERDIELRKVKELRETDIQIAEAPAAIPEKVAQRMGQRMLPFVGLPLFLGLGSFVGFWYFATYKDMEFQPVTVAVTTIGLLVVGLLGITYSIFSTSWDEDRDSEGLGIEEAKKNLGNIKEGLGRSRENAIMREKMATLSEREIERAIDDLDRRDARKEKNEEQQ